LLYKRSFGPEVANFIETQSGCGNPVCRHANPAHVVLHVGCIARCEIDRAKAKAQRLISIHFAAAIG
jgi:hypothetical protein